MAQALLQTGTLSSIISFGRMLGTKTAARPLASRGGYGHASRVPSRRPSLARCCREEETHDAQSASGQSAAVVLTGLAAACLALGPTPALAAEATAVAPKPLEAAEAALQQSKELGAKLEALLGSDPALAAAPAPKAAAAAAPDRSPASESVKPPAVAAAAEAAKAPTAAAPAAAAAEAKASAPAAPAVEAKQPSSAPAASASPAPAPAAAAEASQPTAAAAAATAAAEGEVKKLAEARRVAELEVQRILPIVAEVEAFVEKAVKEEAALQTQMRELETQRQKLASENEAVQKDLAAQKALLASAKAQAEAQAAAAAKEATEEALPSRYALQGIVGLLVAWGLGGWLALSKKGPPEVEELKAQLKEARQQLVDARAAAEAAVSSAQKQLELERELRQTEVSSLQAQLAALQSKLAAKTTQNVELSQQLQEQEGQYARMLATAEGEAVELKRQLAPGAPWSRVAPAPLPKFIQVKFSLQREVALGQSHVLVGSHPTLGGWDLKAGVPMGWGEGHMWTAEVALPPGTTLEFKCVAVNSDGSEDWSQWEDGSNHVVHIPANGTASMGVSVFWGVGETVSTRRLPPTLEGPAGSQGKGAGASGSGNGNGAGSLAGAATANGKKPVLNRK